ncbi:MAG: hypothetical protein V4475_07535 [Pseudomonadota bacterium]
MTNIFTKASLALALGATALTVAAPAEAQRYGHRGHDDGGTAIIAGIAGLAIGAAIVSSSRHRDDRRYDERYDGRYEVRDGYYDDGNGYRDDRYRGGWYRDGREDYRDGRCHVESRWDRYAGERVMVRVCG